MSRRAAMNQIIKQPRQICVLIQSLRDRPPHRHTGMLFRRMPKKNENESETLSFVGTSHPTPCCSLAEQAHTHTYPSSLSLLLMILDNQQLLTAIDDTPLINVASLGRTSIDLLVFFSYQNSLTFKMAIDPTKISVISSKKVSIEQFKEARIDRLATHVSNAPEPEDSICRYCCMAQGSLIAALTTLAVSGVFVSIYIIGEKRVNYTFNGVMRQVCWLAIPGTLIGTSLHLFLAESMWSGKRNSWGQSWAKAIVANTLLWGSVIGAGTLAWRQGLKLTKRTKALQYKYPVPADALETRVMRSPKQFFTGMGWTYWLQGLASGQAGFVSTVLFCVSMDRPHYLMTPDGGYAKRCLPKWRRDFIQKNAIK